MTFSKAIGAEHGFARDQNSENEEVPYKNEVNNPYLISKFYFYLFQTSSSIILFFSTRNTDKNQKRKKRKRLTRQISTSPNISRPKTVNWVGQMITINHSWALITTIMENTFDFFQQVLVVLEDLSSTS